MKDLRREMGKEHEREPRRTDMRYNRCECIVIVVYICI